MSYNIDTCKVKKLENFVIPVKSIYKTENKNWIPNQPKILNIETNEVSISMGCGQQIKGVLKDGMIHVSKMEISGEGSGSLMHEVLMPAFKDSKGEFDAVLVWEGGDSISRLTVKDGKVEETDVEL